MDDSAVGGEWRLSVNGTPITEWQKATVFDCCQRHAELTHALRTGTTPTLNIVEFTSAGPNRGLHEVLYLCGAFTCEYRYGHLSLPFLMGTSSTFELPHLLPWRSLGNPTFSGTATYTKQVDLDRAGDYMLHLGQVDDIAAVSFGWRDRTSYLPGPRIAVSWST